MYTPQLDKEIEKRFDEKFCLITEGEKLMVGDISDGEIKLIEGKFIKQFLATELEAQKQEIVEMIEGMMPIEEDDTYTTVYRHCAEGDHWKCGGYGGNEECLCKCHVLKDLLKRIKGA